DLLDGAADELDPSVVVHLEGHFLAVWGNVGDAADDSPDRLHFVVLLERRQHRLVRFLLLALVALHEDEIEYEYDREGDDHHQFAARQRGLFLGVRKQPDQRVPIHLNTTCFCKTPGSVPSSEGCPDSTELPAGTDDPARRLGKHLPATRPDAV